MTSGGEIWEVLGIAPTNDGRAIRSAYAARLKAIDPDIDPKAFIALREAMEEAMVAVEKTSSHFALDETADCEIEAGFHPSVVPAIADFRRRAEHLSNQIDAGAAPSEQLENLASVLDHRLSGHLEYGPQVERWLKRIVAEGFPQTDIMIAPLIKRYRWDRHEYSIYLDDDLKAILGRRRDLEFLESVRDPTYKHHRLFNLLAIHPDLLTPRDIHRAEQPIRTLLRLIRNLHPTVHWQFRKEIEVWLRRLEAPRPSPYYRDQMIHPEMVYTEPEPEPIAPNPFITRPVGWAIWYLIGLYLLATIVRKAFSPS